MPRPLSLVLAPLLALPGVAEAQLCDSSSAPIAADGRVLGHLPYGDAPADELVDAPAGFALNVCKVRRAMLPDLQRLLTAAQADPAVMGQLRGLSCHRAVLRQADVFCRQGAKGAAADRAISVAPPGHSEHATGYALDFAVRPAKGCPDAEACMAATPAWRWLAANGPRFGFEMSFPGSNGQHVKWEPWHWRWVGTSRDEPGAARARFVFARARRDFPANPGIADLTILTEVPAPPVSITPPPWPDPKAKKKRRR